MKIHCTKADLSKGVQIIQSALSPRTTLPILLNFLIETENRKVKLVSTDLEMGMKHYIPAEIETDGSITIPARKFSDIIQSLQDGHDVDLTVDAGGRVHLKSGRSRFSIAGAPKSEYPVLPSFSPDNAFTLPAGALLDMLKKTVFAASSDETRYVLNGVFWGASADGLELVATDGRRLARIHRKCDLGKKDFRVIVPTKVLLELSRLLGAQDSKDALDEPVAVSVTDNQVAFQFATTTLISRLLEGNFPNYEQVIPKKKDVQVTLAVKDFLAITKRAALCAADRGGAVQYTFKKGALHVFSSSQNLEFNDEIPLDYAGDEFMIAFNPQFIADGLKNIDSAQVRLSMTSPTNPALMETADDSEYQYVVMPIRA